MVLDYVELFEGVKAQLGTIRMQEINLEAALANKVSEREALEATYNAIAPLVGEDPLPTVKSAHPNIQPDVLKAAGISVAVRVLLDDFPLETFTAASVRDRLAEKGWSWTNYVNPQATVYTTLVRLATGPGATVKETTVDGKKAFYSSKREIIAPPPIPPPPPLPLAPNLVFSRDRFGEVTVDLPMSPLTQLMLGQDKKKK